MIEIKRRKQRTKNANRNRHSMQDGRTARLPLTDLNSTIVFQGRHFNFFLEGANNFFLFFNATGLLKNLKIQHFICSNFTNIHSSLSFFFSFFFFFLFFSFFSFFCFFSFSLGGPTAPQLPSNDAPVLFYGLASRHCTGWARMHSKIPDAWY